jgi:hypothetical protein
MPCEKYKEALVESAASGAALPASLREHVDACTGCRTALAAEQSLFAAIDISLRLRANAELPPSLLVNVNALLAEEVAPQRRRLPAWELACAVAVVFLAVVVGFSLRGRWESAVVSDSGALALPSEQHKLLNEAVSRPTEALGNPPGSRRRQLQRVAVRRTKSREPLVLVPPDEREAFARFIANLNGRQDIALALTTPLTERRDVHDESLEVPDLEIAALTVQLLEERDER